MKPLREEASVAGGKQDKNKACAKEAFARMCACVEKKKVIRAHGFRVEGAQAGSPCSAGRTVTQYVYMGASVSGTNCVPKHLGQRLRLRGMAGGDLSIHLHRLPVPSLSPFCRYGGLLPPKSHGIA